MAACRTVTSVTSLQEPQTGVSGVQQAGPTASCLRRATGERYRREMLAHGGGREPLLLVQGKPRGRSRGRWAVCAGLRPHEAPSRCLRALFPLKRRWFSSAGSLRTCFVVSPVPVLLDLCPKVHFCVITPEVTLMLSSCVLFRCQDTISGFSFRKLTGTLTGNG